MNQSAVQPRLRGTLEERFWRKVVKTDGCWIWLGFLSDTGYATIKSGGRHGSMLRAHRLSYEIHVGPIPDGLQIDHLCANRYCTNPKHLEPVSSLENIRRGYLRRNGKIQFRSVHCPTCGAPAGESCVVRGSTLRTDAHRARRALESGVQAP